MKRRSQFLIAASVIAVAVLTWPIAGGETTDANQGQKIEELLKERRDTLQQLVEVVTAQYGQDTNGLAFVVRATDQLIDAELALAKSPEDRIAILQRRVELKKSLFSMLEARFISARGNQADLLAAQAALLESRIQLIRERAGDGGPEQ